MLPTCSYCLVYACTALQQFLIVCTLRSSIPTNIWQRATLQKHDTKMDRNTSHMSWFYKFVYHFVTKFAGICFVSTNSYPSLLNYFVPLRRKLKLLAQTYKVTRSCQSDYKAVEVTTKQNIANVCYEKPFTTLYKILTATFKVEQSAC